tara:strand:- start:237 stop:1295 length:1059 start_codon:yes stop_codon:yes gene_type:complete
MIKIDTISQEGYEKVIRITEPESGLNCVIALCDYLKTKHIALCSIKVEEYTSDNLHLDRTLRYANSVAKKLSYAGLPYTGGSITINKSSIKSERETLNQLSTFLTTNLKDELVAFVEYGLEELALDHLCKNCDSVIQIDSDLYFKAQAKGAYYSIRALQQFQSGNKNLKYKHIVIDGVGPLGSELAQLLDRAGANITVCDDDEQNINDLYAHMHFGKCTVEEAPSVPGDVYVLCSSPEKLDKKSTYEIKSSRIVGVTDAQLSSNKAGYNLHSKDVIYVPEFVAGVGGLVAIAKQQSKVKKTLDKELDTIFTRTLSLLNHSSKNRKPPFIVAEQQMTDKSTIKQAKQPETITI